MSSTLQKNDIIQQIGVLSQRLKALESLSRANKSLEVVIGQSGQNADFFSIAEGLDYLAVKGGGRMILRNGTYNPTSFKAIPSNTTIIGESVEDTIIDFADHTVARFLLGATGAGVNIKIQGMTIKNSAAVSVQAAGDVGGYIFSGTLAQYITFEDLVFENNNLGSNNLACLALFFTSNITVKNCRSSNDDIFYYANGTHKINSVERNYISGTRVAFQGFIGTGGNTGAAQTVFEKNFVSPKEKAFLGQFDYGVMSKNIIGSADFVGTDGGAVFEFENSNHLKISENVFASLPAGILSIIGGDTHYIAGNDGNNIANDEHAAYIENVFGAKISNNDFNMDISTSGKNGLEMVNCDQCSISANHLAGSNAGTAYGIHLDAGSTFNSVDGANVLLGNSGGYLNDGTGNEISTDNVGA